MSLVVVAFVKRFFKSKIFFELLNRLTNDNNTNAREEMRWKNRERRSACERDERRWMDKVEWGYMREGQG